MILLAIFASTVFWKSASATVFQGMDSDMGTVISRTAVPTVSPVECLSIGFKIVRIHESGSVMIAFTSLDGRINQLDSSSALLVIDGQRKPITFAEYRSRSYGPATLHELWFGNLEPNMISNMKNADSLGFIIRTSFGQIVKRKLAESALSDVKEVLASVDSQGDQFAENAVPRELRKHDAASR